MPLRLLTRTHFTEGIKPAYAPHAISPRALWDARNVDVDEVGTLTIRAGSVSVAPSLGQGAVQGMISAFNTLLIVWDKSLYKLVGSAWVAIRRNFLPVDTPVTMVRWTWEGEEVVYLLAGNGVWRANLNSCILPTPYVPEPGEDENLLLANEGGQDPASDIFQARIALLRPGYSSRMALAHNNRLYLSDPDDPTYWPSEQFIQLPSDGGRIVGLAMRYESLIVLRDRDIWAIHGSDWSSGATTLPKVVLQDSSVGCVAERSITAVPKVGLVFLGPDNVYALRGVAGVEDQIQATPIGDDIKPYLERAMNPGYESACGYYHDREYYLCFPQAVEPEKVFRLKTAPPSWFCDTAPLASQYAVHNDELYAASPLRGIVRKRTGLLDDGRQMTWMASFPHEELSPGPARIKRIFVYLTTTRTMQHIDATVIADGQEMQSIELAIAGTAGADMVIGESAIGVGAIGRTSEIRVYEGRVNLRGHFAQVQVRGTAPDEKIGIIGYALAYRPKRRAKGIRQGVTRYDH